MRFGAQVLYEPLQAFIQSFITKYRFHHTLLFFHFYPLTPQFTSSAHLWVMHRRIGEGVGVGKWLNMPGSDRNAFIYKHALRIED